MSGLLFSESKAVCMTEDKKCILRGRSKYNRELCLVGEKSRLAILTYRSKTNAELYAPNDFYKIRLSEGVRKLYNVDTNIYDKNIIGKLIGVKVNTYYELA